MFIGAGKLAARYPKTVLLAWLLIVAASVVFGSGLKDKLTVGGFSDPASESGIADRVMKEQFDGVSAQRVILVVEHKTADADSAEFAGYVKALEAKAQEDSRVSRTLSAYSDPEEQKLLSPDKHRAYVYIDLNADDNGAMKFVERLTGAIKEVEPPLGGFAVHVSGGPGIYYDISAASTKSVANVERIGLPIVFVLLLFVFRSVVAALLPLLVGVCSILTTMAVITLLTPYMQLSTLLTNIVTMLGLGVAIDYALFITQRFREELAQHGSKENAIMNAVATSGRSVFFAGLTVAVSLVSLLLPNTLLFRSVAVGGFAVVLVSIAASLTLLPAVLYLLGSRIDWLKLPVFRRTAAESRFWEPLIRRTMKRPVIGLLAGLLLVSVFLPFIPGIRMHVPVAAFNELPDDSGARAGMEAAAGDFGVGNLFPVRVLLESTKGSVYGLESLETLFSITNSLKELDGVEGVAGLTALDSRLTTARQAEQLFSRPDQLPAAAQKQLASLVSRDQRMTLLYVMPKAAPNTEEARQLVKQIRDKLSSELSGSPFRAYVSGETAMGMDYDHKIMKQIPLVVMTSLILTFILLLIAFRSVVLPVKAILLNGLVTVSALGFLVYMFQHGHMPGTVPQALNVNTPVLLFCILFGLSIDYEVIIVSRIREQYIRSGDHRESIVQGFVATAGIINGGAAIMIAVFGVFVFADIQIVQELGVGLAIAILLDAVLVRTLIVPMSMKLLGRLNWWLPGRNNDRQTPAASAAEAAAASSFARK